MCQFLKRTGTVIERKNQMKIVPAILAEDYDVFLRRVQQAETFAEYVQLDLMDGDFVPAKSFSPELLNSLTTTIDFELHLMVTHPLAYMNAIDNPHIKKVIYHFESKVKHADFIENITKRNLEVGLAVNPDTATIHFRDIAAYVDTVLFMTADPCCYGNPFKPEVIKKIKESRTVFTDKNIGVDGGVSSDNLKLFFHSGVDYVCIGSRIFLEENPAAQYMSFLKQLNSLKTGSIIV
jgi:ribulose-phosphate 3-epimerase